MLGTGWWGELPPSRVRAVPPRRAATLSRPATALLPASRTASFIPQQTFDQVAYELGVVGIALFARAARGRRAATSLRVGARLAARATPTSSRRTWRRPGWRRSSARSPARRSSAERRWRRSSGSRSGSSAPSPCSRRQAARDGRRPDDAPRRAATLDRPRDRAAERRRRGAARDRARRPAAGTRPRGGRSSPARWPTGEESMEYVAHELGVPVVRLPALQRELSPLADASGGARAPAHRDAAPRRRPPHAHGKGGRDRADRGPARRAAAGPERPSTRSTATSSRATSAPRREQRVHPARAAARTHDGRDRGRERRGARRSRPARSRAAGEDRRDPVRVRPLGSVAARRRRTRSIGERRSTSRQTPSSSAGRAV